MKIKFLFSVLLLLLFYPSVFAQQKDFEGIISYKNDVKSKISWMSDRAVKNILVVDDTSIVYLKNGNYRRSSGVVEAYYITVDKRLYYRFKGIDTLYYSEYASDTTSVIEILRPTDKKTIAGIECKTIVLKTASSTSKYFYAPTLYMNPEYDKDNTIGNFNVYTRETSSIWLEQQTERLSYSLTETCIRIEHATIDDTIFKLPDLPVKEFSNDAILKTPVSGGFIKYLQANLKAELGAKYVKIPKGETEAKQVVRVSFVVTEKGEVTEVAVVNKDEVHSKLAEEAIRVISQSFGWKPATVLGQKIPFRMVQPITFYVSK